MTIGSATATNTTATTVEVGGGAGTAGHGVGSLRAVRARIQAPVASFRDPMFPGVQAGLPLPPPATVRGLLAAAHGGFERLGRVEVGMAFRSAGTGVDVETYHPLNTDGRARFPGAEKGPVPSERHFVIDADLTIWVLAADPGRVVEALRRPVWPLRLGRSQDLARLVEVGIVELVTGAAGWQGHAVVPTSGVPTGTAAWHAAGEEYRLATWVAGDRRRTRYADFRWSDRGGGRLGPQAGALLDPTYRQDGWHGSHGPDERGEQDGQDGQLVWPIDVNGDGVGTGTGTGTVGAS